MLVSSFFRQCIKDELSYFCFAVLDKFVKAVGVVAQKDRLNDRSGNEGKNTKADHIGYQLFGWDFDKAGSFDFLR